jgi:hypothetical protein
MVGIDRKAELQEGLQKSLHLVVISHHVEKER